MCKVSSEVASDDEDGEKRQKPNESVAEGDGIDNPFLRPVNMKELISIDKT